MNPLLMPIVAAQARRLRTSAPTLPPASGPTSGLVGADNEPPLRLGVLGESTAVGCGVATHAEGFAASLANLLAARTGRPVEWAVTGQDGATTRRIRHRLLPGMPGNLDVAVLLAGVNDVLAGRTPDEWGVDLAPVLFGLATRAQQVVLAGIPPFQSFPGMPKMLGQYLAERADGLDRKGRRICSELAHTTWVGADGLCLDDGFFSADRFHPSAAGYRQWAQVVLAHIEC